LGLHQSGIRAGILCEPQSREVERSKEVDEKEERTDLVELIKGDPGTGS
jgi:hypothetical protein